ncbi:hypothetical protein HELRODRAFT_174879 [Helobdella robusta]|uniref:Neuroblastoma-amplified sequence N-terminal domain-containing protein n=1 Tax=Helobdella robusta TaxID=6412 RepID=T1F8K5_HELRO|nr:hypothetical protein HELRODRAFT_174879 [Helobdella robusta]ESO01326.1 hypothetical protein HELRODRAFT_174879 [Helobdella robusta]
MAGDIECTENILYVKTVNSEWQLNAEVVANTKELAAILCDHSIEIRSSNDDFTECLVRFSTPTQDNFPQWRLLAWAPDDSILALSDSAGNVFLYNIAGSLLCHISPNTNLPEDLSGALCSIIFKESMTIKQPDSSGSSNQLQQQHWFCEMLILNYKGNLTAYAISQEGDYKFLHSFSFEKYHQNGITQALYLPNYSILLIGGGSLVVDYQPNRTAAGQGGEGEVAAIQNYGVSAWRFISGEPHYKMVDGFENELESLLNSNSLTKKLSALIQPFWSSGNQSDVIFKMAASPDCRRLVTLHASESIRFWSLPSFKLVKKFGVQEQGDREFLHSNDVKDPKKLEASNDQQTAYHVVDFSWWSNEDLIVVRNTGCLTVSSVTNFTNRLGKTPEVFQQGCSLMRFQDGCFYVLECEKSYAGSAINLKKQAAPQHQLQLLLNNGPDDDDIAQSELNINLDSPNDNNNNNNNNTSSSSGSNDNSDQPTTNDDVDVTDDSSLARSLTNYLKYMLYYITDLEAFHAPKKRQKMLRRVYRLYCIKSTTPEDLYASKLDNEEYEEALLLAQTYDLDCDLTYQKQWKRSTVTVDTIHNYLSRVSKRSWVLHECLERAVPSMVAMIELIQHGLIGTNLQAVVAAGSDGDDGSLNFQQKELCRTRLRLLQYMDRLQTYQTCNTSALSCMFTYHGQQLLPHRLAIVNNFPETTSPDLYSSLLPTLE